MQNHDLGSVAKAIHVGFVNYPRISVVTPSYNQARFLEEILHSVHDPGYPNLDHIVIDGGSTDGSVEVLRRHEARFSYWVSERDNGQTDALIKGFSRASGDIWCWLNSDDLFEPWTLFEVADHFSKNADHAFIYGDSSWIDVNGRFIKPKREHGWNRFVWFYDHNYIPQPSTFWRADLYRKVGGIDPGFSLAMDADPWIRFADHSIPHHVRRPWSRARFYPEQRNTALRARSGQEGRLIRSRYLPRMSAERKRAKRFMARTLRVVLKAGVGGYTPSEVMHHATTLIGKGTWESREANRQRQSR